MSDNKKKQLINKGIDTEIKKKLTEHFLERDNNKLNRIKKNLKHGIELMRSMGNKLILEHLKLKEKINNFNSERDIINQEKKNIIN
jgi:hypothetical protein